jgi:hypothetical protein
LFNVSNQTFRKGVEYEYLFYKPASSYPHCGWHFMGWRGDQLHVFRQAIGAGYWRGGTAVHAKPDGKA